MLAWLLVICALVACAHATLRWRGRRARRLLGSLPGYPQLPFLGNAHLFLGDSQLLFRRLVEISRIIEDRMLPFVVWFGCYPAIIVSDPEDVKAVTNTFIEKPYYYNFGRVWLGHGLVTAPGSVWKRNIKKLANTFTSNIVDGYQDVFNAQAQKLVQELKKRVGQGPFDAMHYFALTTLEIICQTALGVSHISDSIISAEYYEAFNRVLELLVQRGFNIFHHPDFVYQFTSSHRELLKCVRVLHNVSDTVIATRRKETEDLQRNETVDQNYEIRKPRFRSFLDILWDLKQTDSAMTEKQIKAEIDTIIVAGQETVATALFYAVLMIGCKPGVQQNLYAEIKKIFGDEKRQVQKEDLAQMRYCEAVILETLRMYPPAPAVLRYADTDLKLKSCTIPEGTTCCVNAYGAGRSQQLWGSDASLFKPERWLKDEQHQPAGFYAFSYGRRACIGKKYAIPLLKTILVYCARDLTFVSKADKMKIKLDIALKPVSGHLMTVHLRE